MLVWYVSQCSEWLRHSSVMEWHCWHFFHYNNFSQRMRNMNIITFSRFTFLLKNVIIFNEKIGGFSFVFFFLSKIMSSKGIPHTIRCAPYHNRRRERYERAKKLSHFLPVSSLLPWIFGSQRKRIVGTLTGVVIACIKITK